MRFSPEQLIQMGLGQFIALQNPAKPHSKQLFPEPFGRRHAIPGVLLRQSTIFPRSIVAQWIEIMCNEDWGQALPIQRQRELTLLTAPWTGTVATHYRAILAEPPFMARSTSASVA